MRFAGRVRDAASTDLSTIDAILHAWFVDSYGSERAEVDGVLTDIAAWIAHPVSARGFLVAEIDDRVVGVLALGFASDTVEIVRTYVAHSAQGTGAGSALVDRAEMTARERGCTRLIVVSGARNRESGYWFWNHRYGEPAQIDEDYFAPGAERVTWTASL